MELRGILKKNLRIISFNFEEAEKRDHRKLGKELNLFHFQEEAAGSVFWHSKGWTTLFKNYELY